MRRHFPRPICSILLVFLLALPLIAHAQEATPQADAGSENTGITQDDLDEAVANARSHAQDAARYAGDASSFLGIFEAINFAVTFVLAALGIFGFARLWSAGNQLTEARSKVLEETSALRKEFEDEIEKRRKELTDLNHLLRQNAEEQKRVSEKATLALSLLPLGERQYRAQDLKGAYETYLRALALDNHNPVIHYRLGYVAVQSDRFADAEGHLKRTLEIDPEFTLAKAALGFTYRRITDSMPDTPERDLLYNKAETCFLEALQQSPKLVDDDGEAWWGSLGGLYRRRGQIEQAIKAYERAAEVTPHSSYPFSNLAMLYMRTQDKDSMLKMFKRVERIAYAETQAEVDNYWAYTDLLTSRLAMGKTDNLEDLLVIMFEIAPQESDYPLESLISTLERLMEAMGGEEKAPQIPLYIARIRQKLAERQTAREKSA